MEFGILGPLVIRGAREVNLAPRSATARHLLSVLALHIDHPVTQSYLCEALSLSGEALAHSTVRAVVTQLRKGPEFATIIRTSSHGYMLSADDCHTDLGIFRKSLNGARKCLDNADPEGAESSLLYALSLWREPHLACLPETIPIEPMRLQLTEEHHEAVNLLTDAQLALGRHRQLIGPLLARTKHYPLDQHCWVQLITALYVVGRHYEAFAVYEQLRQNTAEASGTDPSLEAQRLYRRMLNADPTLQGYTEAMPPNHDQPT